MANFYPKFFAPFLFTLCFYPLSLIASNITPSDPGGPLGPIHPDSLARLGHCKAVIELDTLCDTHEISIAAYVDWTWTGVHQPVVATWSTGITAHKIIVEPPGTWSWNPAGTTCEEYHWGVEVTFDFGFFDGPVDLTAPPAICPSDDYVVIESNLNNFPNFTSLVWSPPNPDGDFEPFIVTQPGTYGITVVDPFKCETSDQVTIIEVPTFSPGISAPVRMCPEGDTATLSIVNPGQYQAFEWDNGEAVSPIVVYQPGTYQVTATDNYGCTGVGAASIQSGEVGIFSIAISSPTLCPGQTDTLRVVGGFSNYAWSNNVTGITNIVNQAGTYTVTVTNLYGCTGTSSTTITPLTPPAIQISNTPLCLGDTTVLTANGGSFPQYVWSSGHTTQNIQATQPGTYTVTVSGLGICTTSTSSLIDFAPAPMVDILPPGTLNCLVNQTMLDGSNSSSGPNYHLNWSTLDGHFISGDSTLNPLADAPGIYILSIKNDTTGCITRDTVVLTQDIVLPPADAGAPEALTCSVPNFAIGPMPAPGNPDLLPSWSTLDGNIVSGPFTWSPEVNQPGTYMVTVTNAINGCTNTASVVIGQDIAPPSAQIAPTDLITCTQGTVPLDGSGSSSGPNFSYLWTTGNGLIAGPDNAAISGAASIGTYNLLVTNTLNGCTSSTNVTVSADVNIPTVAALLPSTLNCTLLNTIIDATGSSSGPTYQYNWSTSNGNVLSGGNTLMPTVDAPGTYTLSLLNSANNCAATLAVLVTEDIQAPIANAGLDAILNCSAPTTILDGTASSTGSNFTYNWTTQNGNILSGNGSLNPTVNMDGTYNLQVTNLSNGCSSSASVVILNDANAPEALITAPTTLTCTTLQTLIDAGASTQIGNLTYDWSGGILSGQGTLQATVDQSGTYTLTITNLDNGCTDVASVLVAQDILVPNALAGSDGLLNCFNPIGTIGSLNNPSGAGFSLQWTSTGGNFVSSTSGPTAQVDQPGTYQLLITNTQNGCTATDEVIVNSDFAVPIANAGPTNVLTCVQNTLNLQGAGSTGSNFSYLWTSSPGGNLVNGANTLTPEVNEPGTYNLLVTNTQNGCTANSQVTITENANGPVAATSPAQTLTCTLTSTTISATGSSSGPLFNYNWSTSNGNIISGANTFSPGINAPGTYTVTVTNTSNLCTETASVTILQNIQSPVVNAGTDDLLTCTVTNLALQAQIVSAASSGITYQWASPNGQILSGANAPNPNIGAPGTYSVTVTDALNGCTGTDQLLVTQDVVLPTAVIANPPLLTCSVQQVTLNATGSSSGANIGYQWTTPSGNFVSMQNPQQPIVNEPGMYDLLLTNNSNGCTQTASVNVLEDTQAPTVEAGVTVGLDCDTPTQTLNGNGTSIGTNFIYSWTTSNGQILSGTNTLTPVIGAPGDYALNVLNTQNGCSETDQVLVTEDVALPTLAIAPPQTLTCLVTTIPLNGSGTGLGNAPNIQWSSANGNIVAGGNTLTPTVDAPGNYLLTVQNTLNGCSASIPVTVAQNIQAPSVQVQQAPLLTCTLTQFALQSSFPAQTTALWSTSNGHIVTGANTSNPLVDQAGVYVLQVSATSNGCTNSAQIVVQQEQNVPTGLHFMLEPPSCNGTPGVLLVDQVNGGVGPFAYSIDGGQTYFPSTAFNQLQPGNYELVIQDANGCEIMEPVVVPSPLLPFVSAVPEFEIELGQNQELLATVPPPFPIALVDTVLWSPMDGLSFAGNSIQQLLNPVATPFHTTQYSVTIVTKEGCKSEARTIVRVDRQVNIYAPNVIRPDDPDGDNNIFLLFARDESVAVIRNLQIFDRWGSLLFANKDLKPNDPSAGWDGMDRGEPVNPGVFVWWAEVELIDGRKVPLHGDVTVVR